MRQAGTSAALSGHNESRMSQLIDALDDARAAAAKQAWRSAYAAYADVDAEVLTAGDHESYGEAAWWSGKIEEAIAHRERAYAAYRNDGDLLGAARVALALCWDHEGRGSFAVAGGWLASAERLLAGSPGSSGARPAQAHARAGRDVRRGRLRPAPPSCSTTPICWGQRVGSRDVQMLALSGKGRSLIKAGEIDKGLALLDEASASAMCGDLRAHSAGLVYCITISSCQDVGDFRRAAEWTEAANRWCDTLDVTGFPGACRIHRAEAIRLRGDWSAAEAQAVAACEELHDFDQMITAGGFYEIAEIRRRRGDFAGAEQAYRTSSEMGRDPQPGLSLLRLAEGKIDAAVAGITRTLEDASSRFSVSADFPRKSRSPSPPAISRRLAPRPTRATASSMRTRSVVDALPRSTRPCTSRVARSGSRSATGRCDCVSAARTRGLAGSRGTVRDRPRASAARRRLHAERRRARGYGRARGRAVHVRAPRRARRGGSASRSCWAASSASHLPLHGHRRLHEAPGDARRRQVEAPARAPQRARARVHRRRRRRGRQADGRRLLRVVRESESGDRRRRRDPARARRRDRRARRPDRRTLRRRVPDRRPSRPTTAARECTLPSRIGSAARAGEILISAETVDGIGSSFRLSEPRTETLKGFEQPVEVVSVDWR